MRSLVAVMLVAFAHLVALPVARAGVDPKSAPGVAPVTVGILLFDGVQIIDFAAPYEVFGQARFGVVTVSKDGKPVETAMGLTVTPDMSFAQAPAFDVLLVPGGDVHAAHGDAAILDFVRARAGTADHVLSVCTGSHIVAAAGLLDGAKATTFHRALRGFAGMFPKVDVVRDVRWVDNGKVITSAGLSSGIDAALHVVARLRGVDAARAAALHLEYDWHPTGGFVRTKMADRYLPALDGVKWPEGTGFDREIAIGDETAWREVHRVKGDAPLATLVDLAAKGVDGEGGWQRIDDDAADPLVVQWRRDAEGRRVTLTVRGTPAAGDRAPTITIAVETAAATR